MSPLSQHRLIRQECQAFVEAHVIAAQDHDVDKFLGYVHEHLFEEDLTVSGALEKCSIRSHTFNCRFKKTIVETHIAARSPREYIEMLRIDVAKKLLQIRDLEIAIIVIALGFGYHDRFIRACHRRLGCSPSRYRSSLSHPDA